MKNITWNLILISISLILCVGCGSNDKLVEVITPYESCPINDEGELPVTHADTNIYTPDISMRKYRDNVSSDKYWLLHRDTEITIPFNKRAKELIYNKFEKCDKSHKDRIKELSWNVRYTTIPKLFGRKDTITQLMFKYYLPRGGMHGRNSQIITVYFHSNGSSTYSISKVHYRL